LKSEPAPAPHITTHPAYCANSWPTVRPARQ